MSILVWTFEAGVFYFAILNFNFDPTLNFTIRYGYGNIINFSTSAPGYFGSFHLAILFALSMFWQEAGTIASFAIYVHFLIWGSTSIAGIVAILINPKLFSLSKSKELS